MKLTSINCPNCNGQLRTENDKLICNSCGSAFAIDYDESDVEHEKLRTEAERARLQIEHDKEMLETQFRLQQEAQMRKEQRERSDRRNRLLGGLFRSFIPLIVVGIMTLVTPIVFIVMSSMMRNRANRSANNILGGNGTTTTTTRETINYKLTSDQVLGDEAFIENAQASGLAYMKREHSDPVADFDYWNTHGMGNSVPTVSPSGDPALVGTYLLTSDSGNYYYMLYAQLYTYDDESIEETRTIYEAVYLCNLTMGENGKINCDYQVSSDRSSSFDWTFEGYFDKDQMYRESILARSGFDVVQLTGDEEGAPEETVPEGETQETAPAEGEA